MRKLIVIIAGVTAVAAPTAAMASPTSANCPVTVPGGLNAAATGNVPAGTVVDATGCDIGVYDPTGLSGVTITGATQYGVYVDKGSVNVMGSKVNTIGDNPLDGMQYGDGIYYTGSATTGTISGNTVSNYQKNGIVADNGASVSVTNNSVIGLGKVNFIAQNGIEIARGASATVSGNSVSGNWYTPATWTACGLLFYQAGGVKQQANTLTANQTSLCNAGRGGGGFNG
jgi:hypothetical protein